MSPLHRGATQCEILKAEQSEENVHMAGWLSMVSEEERGEEGH